MGQIWRNRTLYSGVNQSRLMMTQAEYDQLPSSEKNDGQFRVITDAPSVIDLIYPVGSVYISINNVNPGTYLTGTTWEAFGTGKTLVGVDTAQTEFNTVQKTGGAKTVTLTAAQSGVPSHTHSVTTLASTTGSGNKMYYRVVYGAGDSVANNHTTGWNGSPGYGDHTDTSWPLAAHTHSIPALSGTAAGNTAANASQAHNNLQPYITVYMWKRTL